MDLACPCVALIPLQLPAKGQTIAQLLLRIQFVAYIILLKVNFAELSGVVC